MGNRNRHSMFIALPVGCLSVAILFGLIRTGPTFAAFELCPALVAASAQNTDEQNIQDKLTQSELDGIWRVLALYLILSAVIESALTPVFNWRVFLERAHNKGLRTPIAMVFAFLIVWGYGLDIIRDLLEALGRSVGPRIGGQVLTAFLLAGGSSGVNKLLQTWKIRLSDEERNRKVKEAKPQVEETPPPNRGAQEKVK